MCKCVYEYAPCVFLFDYTSMVKIHTEEAKKATVCRVWEATGRNRWRERNEVEKEKNETIKVTYVVFTLRICCMYVALYLCKGFHNLKIWRKVNAQFFSPSVFISY